MLDLIIFLFQQNHLKFQLLNFDFVSSHNLQKLLDFLLNPSDGCMNHIFMYIAYS